MIKFRSKPRYTYIHLSLLIFILLISSVLATTENLPPQKVNSCVSLPQFCATCSFVTLASVQLPNSTTIIINDNMTKSGSNYNYTFCNTALIGKYIVNTIPDGNITAPYDFDVSNSGITQTSAQGLGSAAFLFLILVLTLLFGWMGFKLGESKNLWILGIFFLFLSILFVVYDVWLGYEYHRFYTGLSDSQVPEIIFYIFMTLLVLGLLVSLALLFTRWRDYFKYIKKEIKRKEKDDIDFDDFDGG